MKANRYLWAMSLTPGHMINTGRQPHLVFTGLALLMAACAAGFFFTENGLALVVPFGLMGLALGLSDFRLLYFAIWATIPFAIEVDLPGGLSTDFPAEPLMWLTCLLLPAWLFLHHRKLSFSFVFHPLTVLVVLHLFWIIITTATSTEPLISVKYTLAKSWYIVCFILAPLLVFRNFSDYRTWAIVVLVPLILSVLIILYRHSGYGFVFSRINDAVIPIYRNHVDYACCLGVLLPFVWFMRHWFEQKWIKRFIWASVGILLTGIYFSYTRAAWLCIPIALGSYWVIRLRLMRVLIPLALAAMVLLTGWLAYDNRYLQFSPNYEKAVTHQQFDDLVSATYRMEDISTVERFYRWVAGYYMVREKPLLGFGPASFYSAYHTYVDRHFTTYVSDNPEHSGIHNYYLMTAVEQGLPGLVIFLVLVIAVLLTGEGLYHRLVSKHDRQLLIAALMSFTCNLFILTLNDTVETDKLGTFFFLCIAIVLFYGVRRHTPASASPTGSSYA